MEVILDIKNVPKVIKPTTNSVIVFNGKEWYLTDKESLLGEAYALVEAVKQDLAKIKEENNTFKAQVAKQLYDMSDIIKQLYEVKE